MPEAHTPAWWEDVEHLREAAERRIAEREHARREGRDPVALTPLRASSERATERSLAGVARPLAASTPPVSLAPAARFAPDRSSTAGAAAAAAASATALALDLDPGA